MCIHLRSQSIPLQIRDSYCATPQFFWFAFAFYRYIYRISAEFTSSLLEDYSCLGRVLQDYNFSDWL